MIILDTNVISELMKPVREQLVVEWANSQMQDDLYMTTITEAELWFGVAIMPAGRRREQTATAVQGMIEQYFHDRVLVFDREAAREHASLAARRQRAGRPVPLKDSLIAAIALSQQAAVATRDVRHFEGVGVEIINPWIATKP